MLITQEPREQATGGRHALSAAVLLALAMTVVGAVLLFSPFSAATKELHSARKVPQNEPVPCGFAVTGEVDLSWICH
ncbi:MAG: hypothetical protein H7274_00950 [Rhodoferax sp.]|nr:hypothetical protein [Rhodoferax sp.]